MLPVTVTSLKNVSPLAVVTPFRRAAGRCACRPDASFFSVRHAVVKVPPARNDVLSVTFSISPVRIVRIRADQLLVVCWGGCVCRALVQIDGRQPPGFVIRIPQDVQLRVPRVHRTLRALPAYETDVTCPAPLYSKQATVARSYGLSIHKQRALCTSPTSHNPCLTGWSAPFQHGVLCLVPIFHWKRMGIARIWHPQERAPACLLCIENRLLRVSAYRRRENPANSFP